MISKKIGLFGFVLLSNFVYGIEIYYEPRPPFVIEEKNTLRGIVAKPLLEALDNSQTPYSLKSIPSKRHLYEIESNQKPVCAIGWFKNPDREKFAKFSNPIYIDKPMGIIVRANDARFEKITNIEKLLADESLVVLTKTSYSYGSFIDQKLTNEKIKKREVGSDNITMLELILKKRADYMFLSFEESLELLNANDGGKNLKFLTLDGMPNGNSRYLICSKLVDDAILANINSNLK